MGNIEIVFNNPKPNIKYLLMKSIIALLLIDLKKWV